MGTNSKIQPLNCDSGEQVLEWTFSFLQAAQETDSLGLNTVRLERGTCTESITCHTGTESCTSKYLLMIVSWIPLGVPALEVKQPNLSPHCNYLCMYVLALLHASYSLNHSSFQQLGCCSGGDWNLSNSLCLNSLPPLNILSTLVLATHTHQIELQTKSISDHFHVNLN